MATKRTPVQGGLQIEFHVGVSSDKYDAIVRKWDTLGAVKKGLEDMGINDANRPPKITASKLTTPNGVEYQEMHNRYLGWFTFLSPIQASIKSEILGFKGAAVELKAAIKQDYRARGDKVSESELESDLQLNVQYNHVLVELNKLQQMKLLVDDEIERVERQLALISRQVELRREEFDKTKRDSSVGYGMRRYGKSPDGEGT